MDDQRWKEEVIHFQKMMFAKMSEVSEEEQSFVTWVATLSIAIVTFSIPNSEKFRSKGGALSSWLIFGVILNAGAILSAFLFKALKRSILKWKESDYKLSMQEAYTRPYPVDHDNIGAQMMDHKKFNKKWPIFMQPWCYWVTILCFLLSMICFVIGLLRSNIGAG